MFSTGENHLLNDVAIGPDGTVYVTDSEAGAVRRLDPGATELRSVVEGGFFYPKRHLVSRGVVRLELDGSPPRVAAARVIETANSRWRVPTTGALTAGLFVYIANSHVDALSDAGVSPAAMVETILFALPVQ